MSVAENGLYVYFHWLGEQRRKYIDNMMKSLYFILRRTLIDTNGAMGYLPGYIYANVPGFSLDPNPFSTRKRLKEAYKQLLENIGPGDGAGHAPGF